MGRGSLRIYIAAIATAHTSDCQIRSASGKREIVVLGGATSGLEGAC